jgi:hypothetical protein
MPFARRLEAGRPLQFNHMDPPAAIRAAHA